MSGSEAQVLQLELTPAAIATAIHHHDDDRLGRRPAADAWSPKEIVCHLRDVDELFQTRFHTILALDEPRLLTFGASVADLAAWRIGSHDDHPLNPDRWAEDRQYARQDTHDALAAFTRRRATIGRLLRSLSSTEWQRPGIHLARGRQTLGEWVGSLVAHDGNHVDQLRRALDGRV